LHGYAETSLMWKPIITVLSERFTVIAPDLPGIGDSNIPADGLDMKNAAIRIRDLAQSLGVQKAEVVGHDIGLMVAYAYAAQFPSEVTKLVLMDAYLSGSGSQSYAAVYARPGRMHAGWAYFVSFLQAAKDFAQLSQTKLTMPVLTIGGDKSLGEALGQQAKLVATDATVVVLKNTGHWVLEEKPKETTEAAKVSLTFASLCLPSWS
jgi:pimeloyl-ACP methyl ester carboxylesterase